MPHVIGFKLRHYRHPFVAKVHRARVRDALNKKVGMVWRKVGGYCGGPSLIGPDIVSKMVHLIGPDIVSKMGE